jgi:cyanophycinase-like exopeptidase
MTGPVALVGSGEYLPVMDAVERRLLEGRPPRFVQLATAAAPEGLKSLARWHELGRRSAERIGVHQVVVPVVDRVSAEDPELAGLIDGAGLIYLSGGKPTFLADTLRDTAVWAAIESAWRAGASLAGCSAGAMALGLQVPGIRAPRKRPVQGLAAVPQLSVLPHFDRFAARMPDMVLHAVTSSPPGVTVVGIDEDTALVGGPEEWEVMGRQQVWVLGENGRTGYAAGEHLRLPDLA